MILRYDKLENVWTQRDPFDDLCCWISGLRSVSYTQDLLHAVHAFPSRATREAAKAVSAHAEAAIQLLEQAQCAAAEVAFLPIYYALLDLAKIYVIVAGRLSELQNQRYHGATHSGALKASHELMTDTITLRGRGAIPLLYSVLTGLRVPRGNLPLKMREVYKYIWDVNYEYGRLCGPTLAFQNIQVDFENDASGKGQRLVALFPTQGAAPPAKKDSQGACELQDGFCQTEHLRHRLYRWRRTKGPQALAWEATPVSSPVRDRGVWTDLHGHTGLQSAVPLA